jgi:hypothetical protein
MVSDSKYKQGIWAHKDEKVKRKKVSFKNRGWAREVPISFRMVPWGTRFSTIPIGGFNDFMGQKPTCCQACTGSHRCHNVKSPSNGCEVIWN